MELITGKEEITYLLKKVFEKYEQDTLKKIIKNKNENNYIDIASELSEISSTIYGYSSDDNYQYKITPRQVRDGYLGLVTHPKNHFVDSCYYYLYGVRRNEFKNKPLDVNLIVKSDSADVSRFENFTKNTRVLMVGASDFNDSTFNEIPNARINFDRLKECFVDENIIGIPITNVISLLNATRNEIYDKTIELTDREDDDSLIFYYVGHGILNVRGELFLATHETNASNFEYNSLKLSELFRLLEKSLAKSKTIILDCSYSGNINFENSQIISQESSTEAEITIMTSTSPYEAALYKSSEGLPTAFTGEFIKVLMVGIDNHREYISLKDIHSSISLKAESNNFFSRPSLTINYDYEVPFAKNRFYWVNHTGNKSNNADVFLGANELSESVSLNNDGNFNSQLLENKLHSDGYSLTDDDILGYDLHAFNLFSIMKDKQTSPPLNIGILAPWGRGKTTLMRKLEDLFVKERKSKLESYKFVASASATLSDLKKWLDGKELLPVTKIPFSTVWFNPWNYQSSDMIWAGMANAVIEQVVNQMPNPIAKESFWFQLRLARIDKEELRKELQIRSTLFILQFFVWGTTILLTTVLYFLNKSFAISILGIGSFFGIFSTLASLLKPNKKDISEVFDKYTKAPQYLNKLGTFHDVQEDLKKVFNLLISETEPLIIFVDDLDRCSPSKIVEVVEAINVFISGEHSKKTYFVLGMDAEIVSASLDVAYEKMKGKVTSREIEQGSLGWYFLDKFIQLPFFIPVLSEAKKLEYLESLFKKNKTLRENAILTESATKGPKLDEQNPKEIANKIMSSKSVYESKEILNRLNRQEEIEVDKEILKQQVEQNIDSDEISVEISKYSTYINSDPRSLKRFANLLRFYNGYQVLRMKKGQDYIPINFLGKYIALMLKFPQLIRWIQWDTENKNGLLTSASIKAQLIDNAIYEVAKYENPEERLRIWMNENPVTDSDPAKDINLKIIIKMQSELAWLRSQNLINILLSEPDEGATVLNALKCNIW